MNHAPMPRIPLFTHGTRMRQQRPHQQHVAGRAVNDHWLRLWHIFHMRTRLHPQRAVGIRHRIQMNARSQHAG